MLRLTFLRCQPPLTHRLYSTHSHLSPDHSIYVSNSTNPYFNLSIEDWLFRHKNHQHPLLLLYRDAPCVVIGRNQNPWKEVNLSESERTGVPWIRRRSGGGTVYHDLGNTNFSLHLPRTSFDRRQTAKTIMTALRSLAIDATVNDRNDICVRDEKVSGSAYKIVNNRAYHHGTMLISSDLGSLGRLLKVENKDAIQTKGVESVRSPVTNLRAYSDTVTHEAFVSAVVRSFRLDYDIDVDEEVQYVEEDTSTINIEYVRHGMDELKTWDWAYGQTPEFTHAFDKTFSWGKVSVNVRSKHGIILECSLQGSDEAEVMEDDTLRWSEWLVGKKYGFIEKDLIRGEMEGTDETQRELSHWLMGMLGSRE